MTDGNRGVLSCGGLISIMIFNPRAVSLAFIKATAQV